MSEFLVGVRMKGLEEETSIEWNRMEADTPEQARERATRAWPCLDIVGVKPNEKRRAARVPGGYRPWDIGMLGRL